MKPIVCDICGDAYKSRSGFWQHKKTHGDKTFICEFCKKSFKSKQYLSVHMLVHTGEKPHECKTCGRSFTQRSNLNRHRLTHKSRNGLFKCQSCVDSFQSENDLYTHLKTHMQIKFEGIGQKSNTASSFVNLTKNIKDDVDIITVPKPKPHSILCIGSDSSKIHVLEEMGPSPRYGTRSRSKGQNEKIMVGDESNSVDVTECKNVGSKRKDKIELTVAEQCKERLGSNMKLAISSSKSACLSNTGKTDCTITARSRKLKSGANCSRKLRMNCSKSALKHSGPSAEGTDLLQNIAISNQQKSPSKACERYSVGQVITILPFEKGKTGSFSKKRFETASYKEMVKENNTETDNSICDKTDVGNIETGRNSSKLRELLTVELKNEYRGGRDQIKDCNSYDIAEREDEASESIGKNNTKPSGEITEAAHLLLNISKNVNFKTIDIKTHKLLDIKTSDSCSKVKKNSNETKRETVQIINKQDSAEAMTINDSETVIVNADTGNQDDKSEKTLEQENSRKVEKNEKPFVCNICSKQFTLLSLLNSHIDIHTQSFQCKDCGKKFLSQKSLSSHITTIHANETPFTCRECPQSFKSYHALYFHKQVHTGDVPIICEICGKKFMKRMLFLSHKRTHEGKKLFKCGKCDKTFNHKSGVRIHQLTHIRLISNKAKRFPGKVVVEEAPKAKTFEHQCGLCNKVFRFPSKLKVHMSTHTKEKLGGQCKICHKDFSTPGSLKIHMHLHEGILFQCDVCMKTYTQRSNLTRHLYSHYGKKPFKCDVCKRTYETENELSIHTLSHSSGKPYQCAVCEKTFSYLNLFKKHFMIHNNERPFKCDLCPKSFVDKHALKYHRMVHTGERLHKCPTCNRGFIQKTNLNRHMEVHSLNEPARRFKCGICSKRFRNKIYFKDHQALHTGLTNYQCDICQKGFRYRSGLGMHLRRHSGQFLHVCDVCGKGFFKKVDLRTHTAVHTGLKPLQCGACKKLFMTKNGLRVHMLQHAEQILNQNEDSVVDNKKDHDYSDCMTQLESRQLNSHLTFIETDTGQEHSYIPIRADAEESTFSIEAQSLHSDMSSEITSEANASNYAMAGSSIPGLNIADETVTESADDVTQSYSTGQTSESALVACDSTSIEQSCEPPIMVFHHKFTADGHQHRESAADETLNYSKDCVNLKINHPDVNNSQNDKTVAINLSETEFVKLNNDASIEHNDIEAVQNEVIVDSNLAETDILQFAIRTDLEIQPYGENLEEEVEVSTISTLQETEASVPSEEIKPEQPDEVKYIFIQGENHDDSQLIRIDETATDEALQLLKLLLDDKMVVNYTVQQENDKMLLADVIENESAQPTQIIFENNPDTQYISQVVEDCQSDKNNADSSVRNLENNPDMEVFVPVHDRNITASPVKNTDGYSIIRQPIENIHSIEVLNSENSPLKSVKRKPSKNIKARRYIPSVGQLKCEVCGASFRYLSKLNVHQLSHSGDKPYLCNQCGKRFSTKQTLEVHSKIHDGTLYTCELCHRSFSQKCNLRRHKQLKHFGPNPFKCDICNRSYVSQEDLHTHMLSHTGEKPYVCETCGKAFPFPGHLTTHRRMHTNERPYKCTVCEKSFVGKHILRSHMFIHSENRRYKCDICGKGFNQKNNLNRHKVMHSDIKPFKCDVCQKYFSSKVSLQNHSIIHNSNVIFRCGICHKEFYKFESFELHRLIHTGDQPLKCDTCGKGFGHIGNLNRHKLIHAGVKPFRCERCGKCLSSKVNLEKHMSLHNRSDKKFSVSIEHYTCNKCGKAFAQFSELTLHMSVHNNPLFNCDSCDKDFASETAMKQHKLTHSEKLNCNICELSFPDNVQLENHIMIHATIGPYKCKKCQISFSDEEHFQEHCEKHTVGDQHKCSNCDKCFATKKQLNEHIIIHTDEKPYACDTCGERFNRDVSLKRHQMMHSVAKPFKCNICDKSLSSKTTLNSHLRSHAGKSVFKCDICSKSFSKVAMLKLHMLTHTGEEKFTCETCGKRFNHIGNYKKHAQIHTGIKPFNCKICKRALSSKVNLLNHMTHHSEEEKKAVSYIEECRHKCDTCGESFPTRLARGQHMFSHMDSSPFKCDICNKDFKLKTNMLRHQATHRKSRSSLTCHMCGMILLSEKSLIEHIKRHENAD